MVQLMLSVRICRYHSICGRHGLVHARMVAPVMEELAKEMAGRVRVAKVNVHENPRTAGRFQVRSIPILPVLKGGQELERVRRCSAEIRILRRLEQVIREPTARLKRRGRYRDGNQRKRNH